MNKKIQVFLLHHSHLDLGYTESKEQIRNWHVDYIKHAFKDFEEDANYKINLEGFWIVNQFLKKSSAEEKETFVKYIKSNNIGINLNFAHMTELHHPLVFNELLNEFNQFLSENDIKCNCATMIDVNGISRNNVKTMTAHGLKFLNCSVHTHHGMFPTFAKQNSFIWDLGNGEEVVVWNGDHYHASHKFGFMEPHFLANKTDLENAQEINKNIIKYISELKDFNNEFIVIWAGGNSSDNPPYSIELKKMIDKINEISTDIEINLTTNQELYEAINWDKLNLPKYSGDWFDWWSDGVASIPNEVIMYNKALRMELINQKLIKTTNCQPITKFNPTFFAEFAEHTFGHSHSMLQPWLHNCKLVEMQNNKLAIDAFDNVFHRREEILLSMGATPWLIGRPLNYKCLNVLDHKTTKIVKLEVNKWESKQLSSGYENVQVVDCDGNLIPSSIVNGTRSFFVSFVDHFEANETKTYRLIDMPRTDEQPIIPIPRDRVWDTQEIHNIKTCGTCFENEWIKISWDQKGIYSIYDKLKQTEMIETNKYIEIIYEQSKNSNPEVDLNARLNFGRNRKSAFATNHVAIPTNLEFIKKEIYTDIIFKYECEGFLKLSMQVRIWNDYKHNLEFSLIMHKQSNWDAENVFLSLPFLNNANDVKLCRGDEFTSLINDQLPGSLNDFALVTNALVVNGENDILITSPDAPVMHFADLKQKQIKLFKDKNDINDITLNSLLMSNYWETNFNAELGGFYQFNYSINWNCESFDHEDILIACDGLPTWQCQ